jgi:hypothetical protein
MGDYERGRRDEAAEQSGRFDRNASSDREDAHTS